MKDSTWITILVLTLLLSLVANSLQYTMLELAELDAAYWHGEARSVPQLQGDVRILQVAMREYCKPIKTIVLDSPLQNVKLRKWRKK